MNYEPLKPCEPEHIYNFLREHLVASVRSALELAEAGQRIRITTLPEPVMEGLCEALQDDSRWVARVLVTENTDSSAWKATATKLIELRNSLKKPLIVFIPPGLRTAAEDSLDVATFRELSLSGEVTTALVPSLLQDISTSLQKLALEVITHVRRERWIQNDDDLLRYLLTVHLNGGTAESIGGALFCFGLIPHFGFATQANVPFWLSRNHKMQQILADVRQPLQARISRLPLEPSTIQGALFAFFRGRAAQEPRVWTAELACNPENQQLVLDNWLFLESDETHLRIKLESLSLPMQSADEIGGTTALRVLNLDGREGLKVSFRAVPPPSEVAAWKTYRAQLLLVDGDQPTVAWESNGFKKPASRQKVTRTLKVGDLQSLEEGTYLLRVDAYDQDGTVLTQPRKLDANDPNSRAENESEYFLVVRKDVEIVPTTPRVVDVASFLASWVEANIRSITSGTDEDTIVPRSSATGAWAEPQGAVVKGETHFKLEGEGLAGFTIAVPSLLRRLELTILENPAQLGKYQLNLANVRSTADIEIRRAGELALEDPDWISFLAARRQAFEAILNQHRIRLGDQARDATCVSLVETADIVSLTEIIHNYAVQYISILRKSLSYTGPSREHGTLFQTLGMMDVTEIRWRPTHEDPGRALLLGPTHPLRMLWHVQQAILCENGLTDWRQKTTMAPSWPALIRQLSGELLPINLPMVIFDKRGRAYVEQSLLTSHWSLFLPDRSEQSPQLDSIASRENCRRLLGIRRPAPLTAAVSSKEIADRAFEYLQQHPYVEQLKINVFNPGDGQVITNALRLVEARRLQIADDPGSPPPLRYSVQMFGSQTQVETMGEAFESLLDPERQVAEDDEFTLTSSNHLLPKLVFARNLFDDFNKRPNDFSSHLTVLVEHFGSQARLGQIGPMRRGSFVGGLVQEPETSLGTEESGFGWYKGLRPSAQKNCSAIEALLVDALAETQRIQAASATGETIAPDVAPVLALRLDSEGKALLKLVHTYSDWVLTIDRNLGLEYFDSPSAPDDSGYLLDYAPEFLQEDRQRILLTTRSTIELQNLIRPAIEKFGLELPDGCEPMILDTLRSLSGRLALRLFSAETHSAEVVGLLLARWLLEQSQLLVNRIVVPLDVHRGWFKVDAEQNQTVRRADLLMVTIHQAKRLLKCQVVEVKLREELTGAGRASLYREMHEQAEATERRVRELFDPQLYATPRADFMVASKELTTALSFYLRRAARYGLVDSRVLETNLEFIENLDTGYSLDLSSLGIVFERQGVGAHVDEEEPGFPVHRFGLDFAQSLLSWACAKKTPSRGDPGNTPPPSSPNTRKSVVTETILSSFRSTVEGSAEDSLVFNSSEHSEEAATSAFEEPSEIVVDAVQNVKESKPVEGGAAPQSDARLRENVSQPSLPSEFSEEPRQQSGAPAIARPFGQTDEHLNLDSPLNPAILLGSHEITPQFGLLGRLGDASVAMDLTGCNTISLFGVQGFGKSYSLGAIAEMATTFVKGINVLPAPLATVIFHYHKSDAYAPEFAAAHAPNSKVREVERLLRDYGALPHGVEDIVVLTPEAKVETRQKEFPDLKVHPIKFSSAELGAESWKFLLGAYGNDSLYVRQLVAIMRRHRDDLTLQGFREEISHAELSPQIRRLAEDRLNLAEPYIDDTASLGAMIRPGRTIIVDLRDQWIEKDEALGLFVVMMRIFASTRHRDQPFNKLMIFDEAHKYISESELISQVVETIREMRHQATSVVIASQDPLSVPRSVIELTSILILHRMTSPQWLKHLKSAITGLEDVSDGQLAGLHAGDALVWAQRSTDKRFSQRPYKIQIRPRFSQHGGGTKTAVRDATVR